MDKFLGHSIKSQNVQVMGYSSIKALNIHIQDAQHKQLIFKEGNFRKEIHKGNF